MGRVAGELADLAIATSDNPRSEDPLAILARGRGGAEGERQPRLPAGARPPRGDPRRPSPPPEPGWAVLVAGKGHEREQIVGDRKLPFSDLEEIGKALEERFGSADGR